jgi:hypothetical protein
MMMRRAWIAAVFVLLSSAALAQTSSTGPIINEFVPNQVDGLETEWIELYNPTGQAINLHSYRIGDTQTLRVISNTTRMLGPGEYIVLAQDVTRFLRYYADFSGTVISSVGWPILNNDGDTIRLEYPTGIIGDTVVYDHGFADNRSWERYLDGEGRSYWGESFSPTGSTPGEPNTYFYPRIQTIDLDVTPDPFSPDGDGFEDQTTIKFNPPEADRFEMAVYDLSGRKVKTFFESGMSIPGEIVWDGRGDDGRMLGVGIYILYAHVEGGVTAKTKRTVVIAR